MSSLKSWRSTMKFKIDGKNREVIVNGKNQFQTIKKTKLSDKGAKLNETITKIIKKREKDETGK